MARMPSLFIGFFWAVVELMSSILEMSLRHARARLAHALTWDEVMGTISNGIHPGSLPQYTPDFETAFASLPPSLRYIPDLDSAFVSLP